jgi:ribosomal protein L22
MKKPHTFKLIHGKFAPHDVRKILMEMIQSKINFHTREMYGMEERGDGNISHSEKRVAQLKKSAETLKKVLTKAEAKGTNLKISGHVVIEFLD